MEIEVVPGVHRIEAPLGERFACMFLLVGSECTMLIDSGLDAMPREVIAPYLQRIGLDPSHIRYVLTTHADFDHMGGNAAMRELAPQAVFMCHRLDREWIEDVERIINDNYGQFATDHGIADSDDVKGWIRSQARGTPMDIELTGGERINLGADWWVDVLHTPGHTRGHLSVYDPRSRTMIIADAALYNALYTTTGGPAFPPTYRFLDSYVATIQRLQGMPIEALLTSHYPVKRAIEVDEFLAESLAYTERVDAAVRVALQRSTTPITMKELIAALGSSGQLGSWPEAANGFLVYSVAGHVERLVSYGLAEAGRRDDRDSVVTYSWKR